MSYDDHFSTRASPQSERSPLHPEQVENSAGGYAFSTGAMERLRRFLILGSEAPTYYAGARELTVENAKSALDLIKSDGSGVLKLVYEISHSGRAPSNDPALFILAMASAHGDKDTRRAAFDMLPSIARTGTHLFTFLNYRKAFGGWGRGMKRAVTDWYMSKTTSQLAYQIIKYRQREGWTHRDVLRQAHPSASLDPAKDDLFAYVVDREVYGRDIPRDRLPEIISGYEEVQRAENAHTAAAIISAYNLPREAVPTEFLSFPEVWDALLYAGKGMPLHALVRNLGNMSKVGLLTPMSEHSKHVAHLLTNEESIKRSRLHPYAALVAMKTYGSGVGFRGSSSWRPVSEIRDALEELFLLSFDHVEPSGKRTLIGLDVSGSMAYSTLRNSNITAREAAACMALVTAKTESVYDIMGFTGEFIELPIYARSSFDDAMKATASLQFGPTDCALPMMYALGYQGSGSIHSRRTKDYYKKHSPINVDTFVVYTDNETWFGGIHPFEALERYRRETGINAKLVVVAMTATNFSIANPADPGMLDVVGFDTAAPSVIADFSR